MEAQAQAIQSIQEDIREIRAALEKMSETLRVVSVQGEKITAIEREIKELRRSQGAVEGRVTEIEKTCIARGGVLKDMEAHVRDDVPADTFWAKLVASGASSGFWIVASGLIGLVLAKVVR